MLDKKKVIQSCGYSLIGFVFPRVLEGAGVPISELAHVFGERVAMSGDDFLTYVGLALGVLMASIPWWLPQLRHRLGKAEIESPDQRVPIYQAMDYLTTGQWRTPQEESLDAAVIMARLRPARNLLWQAASDGEIVVRGRNASHSPSVLEDIPASFWVAHTIELWAVFDSDEGVDVSFHTMPLGNREESKYDDLEVPKAATERLKR